MKKYRKIKVSQCSDCPMLTYVGDSSCCCQHPAKDNYADIYIKENAVDFVQKWCPLKTCPTMFIYKKTKKDS